MVDLTASSIAEVLSLVFEKYERQLIDQDIATCLLAGIITKTNSFQHSQTTPKTFLKASELVMLGGRQQEIIKNVFKTKRFPMLKLWGRALARIKHDETLSVVYSELSHDDLEKSGADTQDLPFVLYELANIAPAAKFVALITEAVLGNIHFLIAAQSKQLAENIAQTFLAKGNISFRYLQGFEVAEFELSGLTLLEAEVKLLEAIRKQ